MVPTLSWVAVLQVLKWLLDAGCPVDVNHPNGPEDSPLQMACYQVSVGGHNASCAAKSRYSLQMASGLLYLSTCLPDALMPRFEAAAAAAAHKAYIYSSTQCTTSPILRR